MFLLDSIVRGICLWADRITPGLDNLQLSAVVMNRIWVLSGQRVYVPQEHVARVMDV